MRSGLPDGLSSLEIRTRPDATMEEMLAWVRSAEDRGRTGHAELGLLFHFVKERRGEVSPGVPRVDGERHDRRPIRQRLRLPLQRLLLRTARRRGNPRPAPAPLAENTAPGARHGYLRRRACRSGLGVPASGHVRPAGGDLRCAVAVKPPRRSAPSVADHGARWGGLLSSAYRAASRGRSHRGPRPARRRPDRPWTGAGDRPRPLGRAGGMGRYAVGGPGDGPGLGVELVDPGAVTARTADASPISCARSPASENRWFGCPLDPWHVEQLGKGLADVGRLRGYRLPREA